MTDQGRRWLAQAGVCLLLSGVGIATVRAQDDSAGPQQGIQGSAGQRGEGRRNGRGIRGTVVAASAGNVTLKTDTGETWTAITTDNTRINRDGQTSKPADFRAGDEVAAMGIPDPAKHEIHAMFVMGASAAQVAKMKSDLGKTYIVGRITAINDTNVTVLRPDKVSQTITLDESTSLRRGGRMPAEAMGGLMGGMRGAGGPRRNGNAANSGGSDGGTNPTSGGGEPAPGSEGEAITLADVKVGDNVGGTGVLKNGVFVPAELHVAPPRTPRAGGGPNNPNTGAPAATGAPPQ